MSRWWRWSFRCLIALLILSPLWPCLAQNEAFYDPPEGVFEEEWFSVTLMGQKVGFAHIVMKREGDIILTERSESMRIGRAGATLNISQETSTRETLDGIPLSFHMESDQSMRKMQMDGTIEDGKVKVRDGINNSVQVYDYPQDAIMVWGAALVEKENGYAPGTQYEFVAYLPEMSANAGVTVQVDVQSQESLTLDGTVYQTAKTLQTMELAGVVGKVSSTEWVDLEDEVTLKSVTETMGTSMEMLRCSKAEALADFAPPEAFVRTLVPVRKRIDVKAAKRLTVNLSVPSDDRMDPPITWMQKVIANDPGEAQLIIERPDLEALKSAAVLEGAPEDMAEYLQANTYLTCQDPKIMAMAAESRGQEKDPLAIALKLREYVHSAIQNANLNVGFATASEVAKDRQGDCTEFAVLLATLGRACKVPTRVVCGLVYVTRAGDVSDVFGFHMWTQFKIKGRWVDMDATFDEPSCNPTHIAFSVSSLAGQNIGELVFPIVNVIGRLKIEIAEALPPSALSSPAGQP